MAAERVVWMVRLKAGRTVVSMAPLTVAVKETLVVVEMVVELAELLAENWEQLKVDRKVEWMVFL